MTVLSPDEVGLNQGAWVRLDQPNLNEFKRVLFGGAIIAYVLIEMVLDSI